MVLSEGVLFNIHVGVGGEKNMCVVLGVLAIKKGVGFPSGGEKYMCKAQKARADFENEGGNKRLALLPPNRVHWHTFCGFDAEVTIEIGPCVEIKPSALLTESRRLLIRKETDP